MIELTRFDGTRFFVNTDFIEFVETTPDTVLSLIDHKKLLVRESADEVVRRILAYRSRAAGLPPATLRALLQWSETMTSDEESTEHQMIHASEDQF